MPTSDIEKHDELMSRMSEAKQKWDSENSSSPDGPDETDHLLSKAMEVAIQQGKGWGPGEKEAYMEQLMDDDDLPPLFSSNAEELEKTGMAEAFSSLVYDGETPMSLMLSFKQKGNDAFNNGKRNVAKNVQWYRDAINHYYEAVAWAKRVETLDGEKKESEEESKTSSEEVATTNTDTNEEEEEEQQGPRIEDEEARYTEKEMNNVKSILLSNAAMAHMQLKNWGHVRDDALKAVTYNNQNVKAYYRLAKAYQMLQNYEGAGSAIESGLDIPNESENKDLKRLHTQLAEKIRKARLARQKRERLRAERMSNVKAVWKWCSKSGTRLGRIPLVASSELDDDEDGEVSSRWKYHFPYTGKLPSQSKQDGEWSWPSMFVYPSHYQSDFIEHFGESEMFAMRMAEMFPEIEDDCEGSTTAIQWDFNNEFVCSSLAVYFEVHGAGGASKEDANDTLLHPEAVQPLKDQASTMRFYESCRALMGDEGPEMANVARAMERKNLHKAEKKWKAKHGSLWAGKFDVCPVVRVHPAVTLKDILLDDRMIVPNFLPTFLVFPEEHPAHLEFLKERNCLGVIAPKGME